MRIGFQGDIGVEKLDRNEYSIHCGYTEALPHTTVRKQLNNGSIIISEGEGKDHFHVITGEDVKVSRANTSSRWGVRSWHVNAPKGAVLEHVDANGNATKDHEPITLAPGSHLISDQREQSYSEDAYVRHID